MTDLAPRSLLATLGRRLVAALNAQPIRSPVTATDNIAGTCSRQGHAGSRKGGDEDR